MSDVYFGIDLGTGNCSVAYVVDDPRHRDSKTVPVHMIAVDVDSVTDAKSARVPSIIGSLTGRGGKAKNIFGWEFLRAQKAPQRSASLLRHGHNYFKSVKSDLGTHRIYHSSKISDGRTPGEVTALILQNLVELTKRDQGHFNLRKSPVAITVPASFSALAREETLAAAAAAGFAGTSVTLIDEPVAALIDLLNSPIAAAVLGHEHKNILVFDYGAGTCDLSLVRARYDLESKTGLEVINLAISPYRRLGGDDVDRAVMRAVVWPAIADDHDLSCLSDEERRLTEDTLTGTVAKGLKELLCRAVQARLDEHKSWAWIHSNVEVTYSLDVRYRTNDLTATWPRRFKMNAQQFRTVMEPFVSEPDEDEFGSSLMTPIIETLAKARVAPSDLDAIVLHGGSCLNPYVKDMFDRRLGQSSNLFGQPTVVATPDRLASVARGAAVATYWRAARNTELVSPIASENLGIRLASGECRRLVTAGQRLPYPGEDEVASAGEQAFAVPDDNLPELLVPLYTGDEREPRIAGTIKARLPSSTPAGTPVAIKINVGADKTLRWWFSVGDGDFAPITAVHDPWTLRAASPAHLRLAEHRLRMKQELKRRQRLSTTDRLLEIYHLRRAGEFEMGLLLVDDLLMDEGHNAAILNAKGLLLDQLQRSNDALTFYKLAMEAEPSDAVLVGNYGATLAEHGRTGEAVAILRRAASMDPTLSYVHEHLGNIYLERGDARSAEAEFRRAASLVRTRIDNEPFDVEHWTELSRLLLHLGEYEESEKAKKEAVGLWRNEFYGGDRKAIITSEIGSPEWEEGCEEEREDEGEDLWEDE